jgi:hypothetical protein
MVSFFQYTEETMQIENIEPSLNATSSARFDNISASIIEHALVVQSCHGTYYAARLLHSKGISISVALRTLTRPDQRRKLTQPALLGPRMYGSVSALMYRHTCA